MDDDEGRAPPDTTGEGLLDAGFGQIHVGGFDDREAGRLAHSVRHLKQQIVRGGLFRTVIDKDQRDVSGGLRHE
ncbi:MAG: hypothetical protein AMXMBFR4_16490 [Candidatus Hydrogenedentota bacterium]